MDPEPPVLRDAPIGLPAVALPLIFEEAERTQVLPEHMDLLWNEGWRHFGRSFFRYSYWFGEGRLECVQPVRVDLARFVPSKGQRRILRRNVDLQLAVGPPILDEERHALFDRHKTRFHANVPPSLADFLGPVGDAYPCPLVEVTARLAGRLVAASYLDLGATAASSVYGIFDPEHSGRSLGIATMLWEMDHARALGCRHYHPGYAFHGASEMDYKKQFPGSEWFDWRGRWWPLSRGPTPVRRPRTTG